MVRIFASVLLALFLSACQSVPGTHLTSEQIAVLKKNGFQLSEEGWAFGLAAKVLFEFDSDQLTPESREIIGRITHEFLDVGIVWLSLEGHTDNLGDPVYNRELSLRRATVVSTVMIENGMPTENITVRGLGDSKPIADNATAEGRSENRRVAIIVAN